jgi:hypothetical protein
MSKNEVIKHEPNMKAIPALALVSSFGTAMAVAGTVNFDDLKTGVPPPGWTATQTGGGKANWTIEKDETAPSKPNVLKQSGEATYPVCIKDDTSLKDGFVQVKFKPVSGKEDQAGGVIWRCKDKDNYYISRANALEDNVRFYKVVHGRRIQLEGIDIPVLGGQWHMLGLRAEGNRFTVSYDGRVVFAAFDDTYSDTGQVALWTKADSVTLFDTIAITPLE